MSVLVFFRKSYVKAHQRRLKSGQVITIPAHYDKRTKKGADAPLAHGHDLRHLDEAKRATFEKMHAEQHLLHHYHAHALRQRVQEQQGHLEGLAKEVAAHRAAGRHVEAAKTENQRLRLHSRHRVNQRELDDIEQRLAGLAGMKEALVQGSGAIDASTADSHKAYAAKLGERFKAQAKPESKPAAKPFTPTHELPDGTPVRATDEKGVYTDASGAEIEDDYAKPIKAAAPKPTVVVTRLKPQPKAPAVKPAATVSPPTDPKDLAAHLSALADQEDSAADDWASRKYQGNNQRIELAGDGPLKTPETTVGAANESRRAKAIDQHRGNAAALRRAAKMPAGELVARVREVLDKPIEANRNLSEAKEYDLALAAAVLEMRDGQVGPGSPGRLLREAVEPVIEVQRQAEQAEKARLSAITPAERAQQEKETEDFWNDFLSDKSDAEVKAKHPQEGDTKSENGIDYVLKDGRWHRTTVEATDPEDGVVDAKTKSDQHRQAITDTLTSNHGWKTTAGGYLEKTFQNVRPRGQADITTGTWLVQINGVFANILRGNDKQASLMLADNAKPADLAAQIDQAVNVQVDKERVARKQELQAKVGAQVKADFEKRKAAGTVGKKVGKARAKDTVTMSKQELIAEHEKLVAVLKSPDHGDDLKEAKEQEKELKGYKADAGKPKAAPPDATDISPAEAAEAERQYQEVKARYQGTPGWLKAPNGKPSKLNERQWVLARTPNYKKWFGDWELASAILQRDARTFAQARDQAKEFQGKPIKNRDSGIEATVSRNSLDKMLSSKAVGKSESPAIHALAVANLDTLFERAVLGWSKPDTENDPNIVAIHRLFAPAMVDGTPMLAKMTVKETAQANRANPLYTVEAVSFDAIKNPAATWVGEIADADGIDPRTIRSAGLIQSMAQSIQNFKSKSVSQMVDASGEPLIAYHGTGADISGFDDQGKSTQGEGLGTGLGHFFTNSPEYASDYAKMAQGNVIPSWLAIKQPLVIPDREGMSAAFRIASDAYGQQHYGKTLYELENSEDDADYRTVKAFYDQHLGATDEGYFGRKNRFVRQQLQAMGYDGIVFKNDRQLSAEGGEVLVAFTAPQVKSAIGNAGTFRPDLAHLSKAWPRTPIFFRHARIH